MYKKKKDWQSRIDKLLEILDLMAKEADVMRKQIAPEDLEVLPEKLTKAIEALGHTSEQKKKS